MARSTRERGPVVLPREEDLVAVLTGAEATGQPDEPLTKRQCQSARGPHCAPAPLSRTRPPHSLGAPRDPQRGANGKSPRGQWKECFVPGHLDQELFWM